MKTTLKKISLFMLSLAVVLTMATSTGMNSEAASKKPTKITLKATSKTVDINVSWGDKTVSMADTLTSVDGSPVTIDEVFSNSKDVSASYKSGCLLCTCSCYAGVVTNEDMPFVSGADIKTMGNKDVLPKAGTIVKITVTLK